MTWRLQAHSRSIISIISTIAGSLVLLLVLLACKRKSEESPTQKAAEAEQETKDEARATKSLQTLASLEAKVNALGAPKPMQSNVLERTLSGYANFDVLLADELSAPKKFPKIHIRSDQYFAKCAEHLKDKRVFPTDCSTPYVVVLKPRTYRAAVVSGSSYTTGKVDATAYVFDMSNGELLGGGNILATTPDSITTKSTTAENDLNDKLGTAAFDSIVQELNVKTK